MDFAWTVVISALGLAIALLWALSRIRYDMTLTRTHIPLGAQNITIAHLSDFHFSKQNKHAVDQAVAHLCTHKFDVLVLTGDYVTFETEPVYDLAKALEPAVRCAKYGAFGCLGNHDHKAGDSARDVISDALARVGVRMLRNQEHVVDELGLRIVGFEDLRNKSFAQHVDVPVPPPTTPHITVALSHNPDTAPILAKSHPEIALQLSGHTHGGQVCLPLGESVAKFFALPNPVPVLGILYRVVQHLGDSIPGLQRILRKCCRVCFVVQRWEWAQGLHSVSRHGQGKDMWLFVTRGIGTHENLRLFCPPELSIIELGEHAS